MLIEYVPYGDFIGYLRKSRPLEDNYFKDIVYHIMKMLCVSLRLSNSIVIKFGYNAQLNRCVLSGYKTKFVNNIRCMFRFFPIMFCTSSSPEMPYKGTNDNVSIMF